MTALPLVLLLSGCVLRYGEPPVESPLDYAESTDGPNDGEFVDFYGLEQSFQSLIHDHDVDVDAQKRLELAGELARRARAIDVGSQLVVSEYLRQLSELEARAMQNEVTQLESGFVGPAPGGVEISGADPVEPDDTDVLDSEDVGPDEEESGDSEEPLEDSEEVVDAGPSVDQQLSRARELLYAWDHSGAIELLLPLRGGEQAEAVEALWGQAVDGIVHAARERAGERFIRARRLSVGPQKITEMEAVLHTLEGLLEQYPETTYRDAVERNIRVVRKDLAEASE